MHVMRVMRVVHLVHVIGPCGPGPRGGLGLSSCVYPFRTGWFSALMCLFK